MLSVAICGILGMRDVVSAATGKSAAFVVRKLFQPILDIARMEAKTATKGRLNKGKANGNGKVTLGCASVVHFMHCRRWEALINVCLSEGGMNNKRVGGRLWGVVCREWRESFAKLCVYMCIVYIYAWQMGWLSGGDVGI